MGLVEEAQAAEARWAKAKVWLDKAKEDRDWFEEEINRLNEMLAARDALLDSANVREELLKSENTRHLREKHELIGKFRRVADVTDEAMDHITQIRIADEAPKRELTPEQRKQIMEGLSDLKPRGRGLNEVLEDHKSERPIPAFMTERT